MTDTGNQEHEPGHDTSRMVVVGITLNTAELPEATGGYPTPQTGAEWHQFASVAPTSPAPATHEVHVDTGYTATSAEAQTQTAQPGTTTDTDAAGVNSTTEAAATPFPRPAVGPTTQMFAGNVLRLVEMTYQDKRVGPAYTPLNFTANNDQTEHPDGGVHTMGQLFHRLETTNNLLIHISPLDTARMLLATIYDEVQQTTLPPGDILPVEAFDPGVYRSEFDTSRPGVICIDGITRKIISSAADDIVAGNPTEGNGSFVALFTPQNQGSNANLVHVSAETTRPQRQRRSLRGRRAPVVVTNQISLTTESHADSESNPMDNLAPPQVVRQRGEHVIANVAIPRFPISYVISVQPFSNEIPPDVQNNKGVFSTISAFGISDRGLAEVKQLVGKHSLSPSIQQAANE